MLCISLFYLAQPTITGANAPVIGDVLVEQFTTASVSQGNGGANQTWDFSTLQGNGDLSSTTLVSPSSTPYAANFPGANVAAVSSGAYAYYLTSSTELSLVGLYAGNLSYP